MPAPYGALSLSSQSSLSRRILSDSWDKAEGDCGDAGSDDLVRY